ncbi:MAG: hypothetical protein HY763_15200 [Planctomycetes bacterium]|nr:hypothetical protein [Planctomycetota bacterium]
MNSTGQQRSLSVRLLIAGGAVILVGTAVLAFSRVGLFDLPSAPAALTAQAAGLAELERMRRLDRYLRAPAASSESASADEESPPPGGFDEAARMVREGLLALSEPRALARAALFSDEATGRRSDERGAIARREGTNEQSRDREGAGTEPRASARAARRSDEGGAIDRREGTGARRHEGTEERRHGETEQQSAESAGPINRQSRIENRQSPPPSADTQAAGLALMREGVRRRPDDLVLANAYRMTVFSLRRDFLTEAHARGVLAPQFPPHLDRQPLAFFEELVREHPSREARLQLALAWVDEMLLFPALEIKAPASVQAVDVLTQVLEEPGSEWYVPALFARGLNHLHRPARLVWPESDKTAPDAAAQDIARCVAAGRRLGVGSQRLQATLTMTLGDAYIKAGRFNVARSWWQIALNLCSDADLREAVHRRFGWRDEDILDRLEEELDRARAELEHPMTDLALMWS